MTQKTAENYPKMLLRKKLRHTKLFHELTAQLFRLKRFTSKMFQNQENNPEIYKRTATPKNAEKKNYC